jgi:hypothetical protein
MQNWPEQRLFIYKVWERQNMLGCPFAPSLGLCHGTAFIRRGKSMVRIAIEVPAAFPLLTVLQARAVASDSSGASRSVNGSSAIS